MSSRGLLGQGPSTKESKRFKPMRFDFKSTNFVDVIMTHEHAFALDDKNQLFSWGSNVNKKQGIAEAADLWEIKKHPYFTPDKFEIHEISAGYSHSIVLASNKGSDKKKLFVLGADQDYHVMGATTKDDLKEGECIHECLAFSREKILKVAAGRQNSMVLIDGDEKVSDGVSLHTLPDGSKHKGVLYCFKDQAGKWQYVKSDEMETREAELPDICFALKYPVEDLETRQFPDLSEFKDSVDSEKTEHGV